MIKPRNSTLDELEQYHARSVEAEIATQEYALHLILKSDLPRLQALLKRRKYCYLIAAGFDHEDALGLIGDD